MKWIPFNPDWQQFETDDTKKSATRGTASAAVGVEALRAQRSRILAVLDWMMPGMDGIEICRRVRAMDKLIYILLLTARSTKEH